MFSVPALILQLYFSADFSCSILILTNSHLALTELLNSLSLHNFAHGTTAYPSWYVQNCVAICWPTMNVHNNGLSKEKWKALHSSSVKWSQNLARWGSKRPMMKFHKVSRLRDHMIKSLYRSVVSTGSSTAAVMQRCNNVIFIVTYNQISWPLVIPLFLT